MQKTFPTEKIFTRLLWLNYTIPAT